MKTAIELAKQAWKETGESWVVPEWFVDRQKSFERLIELVRAEEREKWMDRTAILIRGEREACAKVCDDWAKTSYLSEAKSCAKIIRARNTP